MIRPVAIINAAIAAALLAPAAFAQFALDAPTGGYLYNPATAALHPIAGLTGASTLASPILSGVQFASYSPSAGFAIIARGERLAAVSNPRSPDPQPLEFGAAAGQVLTSWARRSVAVYSAGAFTLVSRTGDAIDTTPLAPGLPPNDVTSIDYDDSTRHLYIAVTGQGLYDFNIADGAARLVIPLDSPAAIAHTAGRVFVLDSKTSTIWTLDAAQRPAIFITEPGIRSIAAAASGKAIYTAAPNRIAIYDLAATLTAELPTTAATSLESIPGGTLFLLNQTPGHPVWLLDDTESPTIFFVPPFQEGTN